MIRVDESDPVGELEPSFPYRDIAFKRGQDVKTFFDLQSEIGRGKFGTVYRCTEKNTGLQLAAKFVTTARREDRRNVEREVDIMRTLQHPRLIQLYDAFDNGKMMVLILELIEGGELFERVIDDDFILTEKTCTVFMRQICEGIEFIHQHNIIHLDMKPENILCLTKTGNRVKIIDFGLARKHDPGKKLQVLFGTPEFVAPEVVNFDQIGFGTDMWSIGVICYVLLSGLSPFMGETDIETMANVTIARYDFDDEVFNEISEDAKDFIRKLLIKDREGRMSASQCLAHAWLKRKPLRHLEELDVAKDNLRCFVERWNEHPNSPYFFDVTGHTISICNPLCEVDSQHSLRGCSPSPCGSLSSSPESVIEVPLGKSPELSWPASPTYKLQPPVPYHLERLHSFERRASDSSCLMPQSRDTASRVNLADEIRKLSDKLYQMAALHSSDSTPTATPLPASNTTNDKTNNLGFKTSANTPSLKGPTITPSLKTPTITPSVKTPTITPSVKTPTITPSVKTPTITPSLKTPTITPSLKTPTDTPVLKTPTFLSRTTTTTTTYKVPFATLPSRIPSVVMSQVDLPSTVKRTKFRVSNMNRDVPIGLPPTASNVICFANMSPSSSESSQSPCTSPEPEAHLTKDLLLHLLSKWEDSQAAPTQSANCRKSSISIDWSNEETLGQRTMNSLTSYIQSSRIMEKKLPVAPP